MHLLCHNLFDYKHGNGETDPCGHALFADHVPSTLEWSNRALVNALAIERGPIDVARQPDAHDPDRGTTGGSPRRATVAF